MLPSRVFRANRTTFGDSKMADQWYYAQGQNRVGPMPPIPASAGGRRSHEIDYEVFGNEMQYVVITPDGGETVIAEPGGLMYMDMGIEMKTVFGDPNKEKSGFFDKLKTAGK